MRVYSWVRFITLGLLGVGHAMRDTPLQRITHGLRSSGECEPLQKYYHSGGNEKLIVLFPEQHTETRRLVACAASVIRLLSVSDRAQSQHLYETQDATHVHPLREFTQSLGKSSSWDISESPEHTIEVVLSYARLKMLRYVEQELKKDSTSDAIWYNKIKQGELLSNPSYTLAESSPKSDYDEQAKASLLQSMEYLNTLVGQQVTEYLLNFYRNQQTFTGAFAPRYREFEDVVPHSLHSASAIPTTVDFFADVLLKTGLDRNAELVRQVAESTARIIWISGGANHFGCHFSDDESIVGDTHQVLMQRVERIFIDAIKKHNITVLAVTEPSISCQKYYKLFLQEIPVSLPQEVASLSKIAL